MEKIKEIIQRLQGTSSRTEKESILLENKDNMLWREVLAFLLDPMVVTGIAAKKIEKYKGTIVKQERTLHLSYMLSYLRKHNTGTAEDVLLVLSFVQCFPEHEEWLLQLFTKSLKLGVEAGTANKVYGKDFVKVFTVMLAESLEKYPNHLDGKEFIITQKLDGCRCVAFVHGNGEVQFFTRNGQDYGEVPDVAADLLKLNARGVAYDGELIAASKSTDTGEVFRKTISTANSKGVKTGLVYHVFDCLPISSFMAGNYEKPCLMRKIELHDLIADANHPRDGLSEGLSWVEDVEMLYYGSDQTMITKWFALAQEQGWEGLMLNLASAPYQAKRVRDLLKVKKFKTVDVRVTGVFEGEGALVGTLGGIIAEFDVDGKTYEVKCGSGFNKEQRDKYWADPSLLVGKIVELKCFEVSKDVDGNYSLRFPIWLDIIRFDKNETSVS